MIKKVAVIALIIVASLSVAGCAHGFPSMSSPTPTPRPTSAGFVFSDGFESGWGAWTYDSPHRDGQLGRHATSGPGAINGATYALETTVVHSGNTAAQFTLPAEFNTWANVYKTVDYATTLYMSGWFMFDASIPKGSYLLVGPCICGYDDHDLVCAYIYNSNGALKWSMEYYTNAAGDTLFTTSDLGPSIQTNVWYNVQVMSKVGNGNGEVAMWVMQQGQSQFTEIARVTGLTNDGDKGPNGEIGARNLQVGPFVPSPGFSPSQQAFSVEAWYDDTLASTRAIGPESNTWTNKGGQLLAGTGPAASNWGSARTDWFVTGTSHQLYHMWVDSTGTQGWENLGGYLTSSPSAVSWGNGRIDTFARGNDGALWWKYYQNGWSDWQSLGGQLAPGTGPAVSSWAAGRLDVFVVGTDNQLWSKAYQSGPGWSGWEPLGGYLTASPAAVSWGNGRIDVFVRGTDGALWSKAYENGWSGWGYIGGQLAPNTGPAVSSWAVGRLDLFVVGTDNALWHKYYQNGWSGWESVGGYTTSSPAATSRSSGTIDVGARGTDGALYTMTYTS